MQLPDGFHYVEIDDGTRNEDFLTWSDNELAARLRETRLLGSAQEWITCGYCGAKRRCRTGKCAEADAQDWFRLHDCRPSTEDANKLELIAPERESAPLAA